MKTPIPFFYTLLFFILFSAIVQGQGLAKTSYVDAITEEDTTDWTTIEDKNEINERSFRSFHEKYKSDKDFQYNEKPLKKEQENIIPEPEPEPEPEPNFDFDFDFDFDFTPIGWVLCLSILIGLIYLVYKNLNPSNNLGRSIIVNSELIEIEKLTEEEIVNNATVNDFETLIKKAEEAANYRLALRLQFIRIYKLLITKKIIDYKKDKTNYDYSLEIQDKELKSSFKKISHWYDYVWYGEYQLDISKYQLASRSFNEMKDNIR